MQFISIAKEIKESRLFLKSGCDLNLNWLQQTHGHVVFSLWCINQQGEWLGLTYDSSLIRKELSKVNQKSQSEDEK